ncbi:MAG TPA: hypothetical protein VF064_12085 [Pyrinomonadaceae bacterium]
MKRLLLLVTLLSVPLGHAAAQTPPAAEPQASPQSEKEKAEARAELEKKALVMLEQTIGDAMSLRVPENRVRVLAGAADLLWPRDEKRARSLFRDALLSLNEASANSPRGREQRHRAYWTSRAVRQEALHLVARRDPQLALELLQATRQGQPPPDPHDSTPTDFHQPDHELHLEHGLLSQVAANDPKRALQLATESLSKGYSVELLNLVRRLNEKDAEAATKFAGEVARRLRAENLLRNREALHVAAQFLQSTAPRRQTMVTVGAAGGGWAGGKPLALDEQTRRDLVDALVSAALAAAPAEGYYRHYYLFSTLRSTMAEVEKLAADRAPLVRRRMAEFEQTLGSANRKWADYEQLLRQDSPDALLEAAAKVPAEMRPAFYSSAAFAALGAGDAERARKIVGDNFSGGQRTQMLELLDHRLLLDSLKQGKVEEAKNFVARIRDDEKRAGALAKLALWAASKGDRKTARLLLAEAREIVGERPRNLQQLEAHLQLARAYALVEPPRAFEIVEMAVDRANDMIAAADVLDGFLGGPEIFRDGELLMPAGVASLETIFEQYGRQLAELARADFDRAKAAASRFSRVEVRAMARLLVAQGLLSDRQPPEPTPEALMSAGITQPRNF